MADTKKSVGHIIDILKEAKDEHNMGCSLLIGAGCSVTAGIKTGEGFVDIIKKKFPHHYEDASEPKNYPQCMAELSKANRRKLVKDQIKDAKINWAHICIALLLKENYVDRVLTTNFDPLISRACALLGEFPAVYDFAASQTFKPEYVPDKAIFHLHGQHTGFDMLHDDKETKKFSKSLKPVFEDASQGRLWIVVGYSGECDPVFDDHLSKVKEFECGLYWVGYKDHLDEHVQDNLLSKNKSAYHIAGHDADSFFIELTQGLKIFPPELITKPFHHLNKLFDGIQPFPSRKGFTENDVTETARQQISQAMQQAEEKDQKLIAKSNELLMSGDYNATLKFLTKNKVSKDDGKFSAVEASAYFNQGWDLLELSGTQSGKKQQNSLKQAIESYQQAIKIRPNMGEAFVNLGSALISLGKTQSGEKQKNSFKQAIGKTRTSLKIMPHFHVAVFNMACVEALKGNETECRKWLEKRVRIESLSEGHINDPDFDSMRDKAWFKKLVG